jgi:hypothetical protein
MVDHLIPQPSERKQFKKVCCPEKVLRTWFLQILFSKVVSFFGRIASDDAYGKIANTATIKAAAEDSIVADKCSPCGFQCRCDECRLECHTMSTVGLD